MKEIRSYFLAIVLCFSFTASLYAVNKSEKTSDTGPSSQKSVPDVILLDSLADQYEAVEFDHSMHISFAEDCSQCHHQHIAEMECDMCHAITASTFKKSVVNSFLSCRDCHETFDPNQPGLIGLKGAYHRACFQCHQGMGSVGLDPKGCTESCHAKMNRQARK
jgi:hypothetical protein